MRPPRASLALSLALHGLIGLPLLVAGSAGSASVEQPVTIVDVTMTSSAPTVAAANAAAVESTLQAPLQPDTAFLPPEESPPLDTATMIVERRTTTIDRKTATAERETKIDLTPPEEPPPLDTSTLKVEREIKIDLAPAEEPPPLDTSALKPVESPKPKPAPKSAPPVQAAKVDTPRPANPNPAARPAVRSGAPSSNFGSANDAQQAASGFLPAPAIVWEGKPRFRHPPTPAAYPPRAVELSQQGEALVRVRLDTAGTAVEIILHRSSGHHALDSAALAAVRSWHFLPAMRDGRPVPSWVEIPVRFHLR